MSTLSQSNIDITSAKVLVLGAAYKGEIDDTRNSPAIKVSQRLSNVGMQVDTYDPYVDEYKGDLNKLLDEKQAVVICTEHDEFKNLDLDLLKAKGVRIIIDGRNLLDKEKIAKLGIIYKGIGR